MEKKKLKLEIIDATGVVIRTHHLFYEAQVGLGLRLTVDESVYDMWYDGRLKDYDNIVLDNSGSVSEPRLKNLDEEWATEFKKRVNEDNDIVNLGEGLDLKHVYAFNKRTGETQRLFDEKTLVPIPKKKL